MNLRVLPIPLSFLFLAACGSPDETSSAAISVINIAEAIKSPVDLKVSDLGSKITYVPFETTDESLIPNYWQLTVTDHHLIVSCVSPSGLADTHAIAFDLNGRFISTVGHVGDDPEAYNSPVPLVGKNDNMFFPKWGQKATLVEYNINGRYLGRFFPQIPVSSLSSQFIDTTLVSVSANVYHGQIYPIVYSGGIAGGRDSLVVRTNPNPPEERYIYEQALISTVRGVMRNSFTTFREINERGGDKHHDYMPGSSTQLLWKTGGDLHYRFPFNDTIYSVSPSSFEPLFVFDCGPDALKPENFNHQDFPSNIVFVSELAETPSKIVFGASRGWLNVEDHHPFVGYFDKSTGKTFATQANRGFVDDLTGFMPFYPVLANNRGDLFGILTMDDILAWLEENPGATLPEPLRDLSEDSNPVCVIVSR